MTHRRLGVAFLILFLPIAIAWAHPTFESLWKEATDGAGCAPQDYTDFILVTCKDKLTLWYFTKPNHPAHPGVIKRIIEEKDGGFVAHEEGSSFGPDSAQPAFKAWLAEIADLDRKMKEDLARRGQQSGAPSN